MNVSIRRHFGCAAFAAVGACTMIFFLATGAVSPEPSDHPERMLGIMNTLPGHMFYLGVTFLCLPAFLLTSLALGWGWLFWVTATALQMGIFFGAGLVIAESIRGLTS